MDEAANQAKRGSGITVPSEPPENVSRTRGETAAASCRTTEGITKSRRPSTRAMVVTLGVVVLTVAGWRQYQQWSARQAAIAHFEALGGVFHDFGLAELLEFGDKPRLLVEGVRMFEPKCVRLDLADSRVLDVGLGHLSAFPQLKGLYLSGTPVTDAGLMHLSACIRLRELELDGAKITDAGLQHVSTLSKLTLLDLNNTQIGDVGLEDVTNLSNLQDLYLTGSNVTSKGVARFEKAHPDVNVHWRPPTPASSDTPEPAP